MFRSVLTNHRVKELMKEINGKELTIAAQQNQLMELQKIVGPIEPEKNEEKHLS